MIFRKIRKISVIFMKFAENQLKSTRFRPKFHKILPEFQQIVDDRLKSIDFAGEILEIFKKIVDNLRICRSHNRQSPHYFSVVGHNRQRPL